jgi:hypothetical protein
VRTIAKKKQAELTVNRIAELCGNNSTLIAKVAYELGLHEDMGWYTNAQWIAQEFAGVENQEFYLKQVIALVR